MTDLRSLIPFCGFIFTQDITNILITEFYMQDNDSLKERMVKMEAELNKLREEVSNRTKEATAAPPSSTMIYSSTKLGSNGANSSSPTPSPPSHADSSPPAHDE